MLKFRPHHFLCTVGFQGKGYSPEFVAGYQKIADLLRESPDGDAAVIEVAGATDSICEPCPNRRGELCTTEAKIQKLDAAHAAVLGLRPGERLTWGEAKARIADRFSLEAFDRACEPCGWKAYGMCKDALIELKKEESQKK